LSEKEIMCGKRNSMLGNAYRSRFAVGLALLAIAGQARALYTNFLNDGSNTLAGAYASLTNNPSLTRQEQRDATAIQRALKEFRKSSVSVAMDCSLFRAATAQLHGFRVRKSDEVSRD
jgi:hypothetical protein